MRRRRAALFAALALTVVVAVPAVGVSASGAAPTSSAMVRFTALTSRLPKGSVEIGSLPATRSVSIAVVLRPSHQTELDALMQRLYDPTSPGYEHWLTPGEFDRQFGPSRTQIAGVTSWLRARGLTHTSVLGMTVRATAPASDVARALSISFGRYRLAGGTLGYATSAAPLVPKALTSDIATIMGLSDTFRFHDALDLTPDKITNAARPAAAAAAATLHAAPAAPAACAGASQFAGDAFWTADQVGRIYHVNTLFAAGMTAKGKTIALLELAPSLPVATTNYLKCFGLLNSVRVQHVDGGGTPNPNGSLEAEIDIQEAATQAPGASIVSYEAPNTALGNYDAYNKIVTDDTAQVVSTSWGECEAALEATGGDANALHALFQRAAAQGQSVFAASGDQGSEDCYDGTSIAPSQTLQVDNPADDPFVTGVGGTSLQQPGVEPVWNDCGGETGSSCAASGEGAGGGGQSSLFTRPAWQVLAQNATCSTCREVPDISANAGVGETFYYGGHWTAVGGTSIAAPKLAGIVADIDQGCTAGKLGDFAHKLTALAALPVYGTAIADVTTGMNWTNLAIQTPGSNDLTRNHAGTFKTTTRYDLATGFGVPIAPGLACPQVISMSPTHGTNGTHITLHGIGLERATIKFGNTTAKILSATATTAVVIAPAGSGTVHVTSSDPIGTGNRPVSFSYP